MFKSLVPRNTTNPLVSWHKEMNDLFDKFNRDLEIPSLDSKDFSPRVEVKDQEKGYLVKVEIPGIEEKDLDVTLKDNSLILAGERKSESTKEDKGHYFSEFSYGSFYRAIPLEEEVNQDKVNAKYQNGILTVELEKVESKQSKAKKIQITKH
jgi:HSP20 family protein